MKRAAPLLAFVLLGCGSVETESDRILLVEGGRVASVTDDQRYLAYYTEVPTDGHRFYKPWVRPLPSGDAVPLADTGFAAGFGSPGDTLTFVSNPVPATNSANNAPGSEYGALSLWTPALAAPIQASTGFVTTWARTRDHGVTVFFDNPKPSSTGAGALRVVRIADCSGEGCSPMMLAEGVHIGGYRVSHDGRFVAYAVVNADQTRDFFLAAVGASPQKLATTVIPAEAAYTLALVDFSTDGSLLAMVGTVDGKPMQLQVFATSTGLPVAWGAQPVDTLCTDIAFLDSMTLFTELRDAAGKRAVYRSTADSAMTHFVDATQFGLWRASEDAKGVMFVTTADEATLIAGTPTDLQLVDPAAAEAAPILLADAAGRYDVSEDRTAAWLLDDYEPNLQHGTLKLVSLPDGKTTTVASSIYAFSPSFARRTNRLLYVGAPTTASLGQSGSPIFEWTGGKSVELEPNALGYVTAPDPLTLYVTVADPIAIYERPLR